MCCPRPDFRGESMNPGHFMALGRYNVLYLVRHVISGPNKVGRTGRGEGNNADTARRPYKELLKGGFKWENEGEMGVGMEKIYIRPKDWV